MLVPRWLAAGGFLSMITMIYNTLFPFNRWHFAALCVLAVIVLVYVIPPHIR